MTIAAAAGGIDPRRRVPRPSIRSIGSGVLLVAILAACSARFEEGWTAAEDAFAKQLCAIFAPCCNTHDLPANDPRMCVAYVQRVAMRRTFDPAAADACLAELRADAAPYVCALPYGPSCGHVFSNGKRAKPGEPCSADDDCARSSEGEVHCLVTSGPRAICQLWVPGQADDGPCTTASRFTAYNFEHVLLTGPAGDSSRRPLEDAQAFKCSGETYCDESKRTCVGYDLPATPLVPIGARCGEPPDYAACAASASCDTDLHACVPSLPRGADCSARNACAAGLACTSSSKICLPQNECARDDDSYSGMCSNGWCYTDPSTTDVLVCGARSADADADVEDDDDVMGFVSRVCEVYRTSCCAPAGYPADVSLCDAVLTRAAAGRRFDPAAAEACVADLKAQTVRDRNFCSSAPPASCAQVLAPGGARQPGEACKNDDDCAPSTAGRVRCVRPPTEKGYGLCEVLARGAEGDAPCASEPGILSVFRAAPSGVVASDPAAHPATTMSFCDAADGLVCDPKANACARPPAAEIGEPCPSGYGCVAAAFCLQRRCIPRLSEGQACTVAADECAADMYCGGTCKKLLPIGGSCTSDAMCQSQTCVGGVCVPKELDGDLSVVCGPRPAPR